MVPAPLGCPSRLLGLFQCWLVGIVLSAVFPARTRSLLVLAGTTRDMLMAAERAPLDRGPSLPWPTAVAGLARLGGRSAEDVDGTAKLSLPPPGRPEETLVRGRRDFVPMLLSDGARLLRLLTKPLAAGLLRAAQFRFAGPGEPVGMQSRLTGRKGEDVLEGLR